MILTTAAGFAVQYFAGIDSATAIGALIGLLAAPLVPGSGTCGLRER